MARSKASPALRLRPRITRGAGNPLGPGKADLLEGIAATGSLAGAARGMGMSYMKAWTLLREMEAGFSRPVVKILRGGAKGGGAELTANGKRILALYREMEAASTKAAQPAYRKLRALLKE